MVLPLQHKEMIAQTSIILHLGKVVCKGGVACSGGGGSRPHQRGQEELFLRRLKSEGELDSCRGKQREGSENEELKCFMSRSSKVGRGK